MKPKLRMLDLFCGRFGWGRAFAARGWEVVGVDLVEPAILAELPRSIEFYQANVLGISHWWIQQRNFDFICASSPCEQFSVHGMKHFHPNPPCPELGIKLFNHTRRICEASRLPYVMENVRAAQDFVGQAANHCGPFYLWGNAVPPIMPQGIIKGWEHKYIDSKGRKRSGGPGRYEWSTSQGRREATAKVATIPPELANTVADYAERIACLTN